jgi:RimJ/RimL family protein N-acetyltransferase
VFSELPAPLTDGRVSLRYYAERDIPEILIAYQDDPELHVRIGQPKPPTGAQLGRWAEDQPEERAAGTYAMLTILEPGDDTFKGQINVHHVDWEQRQAELGVWLVPQVRGRGMAAAALRLAAAWLLDDCGLDRLVLKTETDNQAMIRAARTAGFTDEGVEHDPVHGDSAIMSLS